MRKKTLLAIMPHPDDESLGFGGTLAKYGHDEMVSVELVCATRGEKGDLGDPKLKVTRKMLPQVREQELYAAAKILNIDKVHVLDYIDGEMMAANEEKGIGDMVRFIRKIKPQVVIGHGPEGGYGHPDHIALSGWVSKAIGYTPGVRKLYHKVNRKDFVDVFAEEFGHIDIDGQKLLPVVYDDSFVSAIVDCSEFVDIKFKALHCHKTQMQDVLKFEKLRSRGVKSRITHEYYHRALSRGEFSEKETDLFDGL